MLPSKKRRNSTSLRGSSLIENQFDISNNAFASAILEDDSSEDSSGIHHEGLVESIMNHEAAVIDEQQQQQQQQDRSQRSDQRGLSSKAPADIDDYSFRPLTGFVDLPHHDTMKNRGDRSDHTPSTSVNTRRSSITSSSTGNSTPSAYQQQQGRQKMPARGGFLSTSSIFSSGLTSIKVQVSELDKMFLQHSKSPYGEEYEVPLPQLPHEGKKACYIRLLIAFICLVTAATINIRLGQGELGRASASYLYNTYILGGGPPNDNHVLNDDTTRNGSHLFEKVDTIERGFRRNLLGDPAKHIPSLTVKDNGNIEVSVQHEMTQEHYIEFIWVKDVVSNKVVLARSYNPTEQIAPSLKAKVPEGVKLRPYLFCNLHELWVGDEVHVP